MPNERSLLCALITFAKTANVFYNHWDTFQTYENDGQKKENEYRKVIVLKIP